MLEFKRTSDPIGAWMEDNCIFEADAFVARKATFEDYKNYTDQELGKTPETERRFYQRLRDTPKVKDWESNREGRGFKGIRLRNPEDKIQEEGQTQLISTAATTGNSNCQKT
jgi:phage/plasmid-associated DNA primase